MSLAHQFEETISGWFPDEVAVGIRPAGEDPPAGIPELWLKWSAPFADSRRRQFLSGRLAAADSLKALGHELNPGELGVGDNRTPIWPDGFCGSITHSKTWALAVAGRARAGRSLGIDLEEKDRLSRKTWRLVLTPVERKWVTTSIVEANQLEWGTLLFSMKEAFYKWQYPLTGEWLGFQEVEITLESSHREGIAQLAVCRQTPNKRLRGLEFTMNYTFFRHCVLTCCGESLP